MELSSFEKLLYDVLCGRKDNNISFSELRKILNVFGFSCRIKGDHYIYTRDDIEEIINIQPNGNKAKAYQVKQVRLIILKYKLGGDDIV